MLRVMHACVCYLIVVRGLVDACTMSDNGMIEGQQRVFLSVIHVCVCCLVVSGSLAYAQIMWDKGMIAMGDTYH